MSNSNIAAFLVLLSCIAASRVSRGDEWLRPSTKPLYFTSSIGPAIGFAACDHSGNCATGSPQTAAIWYNEVGGHLTGRGDGPLLAGYLHVGGGNTSGVGYVRFGLGAKFGWDIPLYKDALYFQPSTSLGYGLSHINDGGGTYHYAQWMASGQIKLVLNDVGIVYVQPITLDVDGNDQGVTLYWNVLFGGGTTF
jgi:hypothetical protein